MELRQIPTPQHPAETAPLARPGRERLVTAAVLTLVAFAFRIWQFGNPLIDVDENFYLLVGDRMLQGAVPYVDIWDRKPIGLFLIYAAIRLLGGDGVVQYQFVATLFAAGTAYIVARLARRTTSAGGAAFAGVLYLMMIGLAGGMGGQAPIFYNLLVAGAALAVADAVCPDAVTRAKLRTNGAIAMALIGCALQVKYSAVFEGVFFGIVLLNRARKLPGRLGDLAVDAALWIGLALLPSGAATAAYALLGHLPEFMHANFLSIFARSAEPMGLLATRLGQAWSIFHIPAAVILLSAVLAPWRAFPLGRATFRFVMAWLGAALFGYLVFGSYFNHYALPLMPPVAVACAPLFSYRPHNLGRIMAGFMLLAGVIANAAVVRTNREKKGGPARMAQMVSAIRPHLTGCLYLYDGDVMLYYELKSCLLTRYPFPTHLNLSREASSIGVEPLGEIRRIFALRPSVVVDTIQGNEETENPAANRLARGIIRRDYRPIAVFWRGKDEVVIYALSQNDR